SASRPSTFPTLPTSRHSPPRSCARERNTARPPSTGSAPADPPPANGGSDAAPVQRVVQSPQPEPAVTESVDGETHPSRLADRHLLLVEEVGQAITPRHIQLHDHFPRVVVEVVHREQRVAAPVVAHRQHLVAPGIEDLVAPPADL